jgi:HEAT repeat protein
LLENKDQDIRGVACQALGRIGVAAEIAERHLERLAERDPVDFVRRAAERARARIRLSESRRTRAVRPPMPGKIAGKS